MIIYLSSGEYRCSHFWKAEFSWFVLGIKGYIQNPPWAVKIDTVPSVKHGKIILFHSVNITTRNALTAANCTEQIHILIACACFGTQCFAYIKILVRDFICIVILHVSNNPVVFRYNSILIYLCVCAYFSENLITVFIPKTSLPLISLVSSNFANWQQKQTNNTVIIIIRQPLVSFDTALSLVVWTSVAWAKMFFYDYNSWRKSREESKRTSAINCISYPKKDNSR